MKIKKLVKIVVIIIFLSFKVPVVTGAVLITVEVTKAEKDQFVKQSFIENQQIELPIISDFSGVYPISKEINLKVIAESQDVGINQIAVNGKLIKGVSTEKVEYLYYFPYTYNQIPEITVKPRNPKSIVSVSNVQNLFGEDFERTATITITSEDGTQQKNYKIIFTVLPKLDLFLCVGQSNMAGYAPVDPNKGDLEPVSGAYLFNSSQIFEDAQNGMNRYSNILSEYVEYYSLTYSFAKQITQRTQKPIGLVVNARGGASIESWEKEGADNGDTLYLKTMERALEANKWGEYKAILWHQGEANRFNFNTVNYMSLLKKIVNNLRIDLDNHMLFFVAGEIGRWDPSNQPFNTMLNTIKQHIENSACVSAENLVNIINDNSHFNRDALESLGERYANQVLDKIYNQHSGFNDIENNYLSIKLNDCKLCLRSKESGYLSFDVNVYNILGQLKYQNSFNDSAEFQLNKGINIVDVKTSKGSICRKFFIK